MRPASGRRPASALAGGNGGFGLVETAIALLLTVMVVGLALGLLRHVTRTFVRSEARLAPRECGRAALTTLRAALSDAVDYAVDESGSGLTFATFGGSGEVKRDGKTLGFRTSLGGGKLDRVFERVLDFRAVELKPGLLRLMIRIAREGSPDERAAAGTDVLLFDDVYLPAVALRLASGAWNPVVR